MSSEQARHLFESVVGGRTGLVRWIDRILAGPNDARIVSFLGRTCRLGSEHTSFDISGVGVTLDEALIACLCEGVERYAGALYYPDALRAATCRELDSEGAMVPEDLSLYHWSQFEEADFPYEPFDLDSRVAWVRGRMLASGAPVWVPAFLVYLGYIPSAGEALHVAWPSTGLAAGQTWSNAVLHAILEVVERDALACVWLNRLTPPEFALPVESDPVRLIPGFETAVYDLTSDLQVPTALAVAQGEGDLGPIFAVGCAAHTDYQGAIDKALIEAAQDKIYIEWLIRHNPEWRAGSLFERVDDFRRHALFYSVHHEYRNQTRFLRGGDVVAVPEAALALDASPETRLDWVVQRLARKRIESIAIDLTTEDVAAVGLRVVRVVVPQLQPLHGNHLQPFLGGARLSDAAEHFPRCRPTQTAGKWNSYPHPMP